MISLDTKVQDGKRFVFYFDVKGFDATFKGDNVEQNVATFAARFREWSSKYNTEVDDVKTTYESVQGKMFMAFAFTSRQPKGIDIFPTVNGVGTLLEGNFVKIGLDARLINVATQGQVNAEKTGDAVVDTADKVASATGKMIGNATAAVLKPLMPVIWVVVLVIAILGVLSIVFKKEVSSVTMKAVGGM